MNWHGITGASSAVLVLLGALGCPAGGNRPEGEGTARRSGQAATALVERPAELTSKTAEGGEGRTAGPGGTAQARPPDREVVPGASFHAAEPRGPTPSVAILAPMDGAMVHGTQVTALVKAVAETGVATVEVCFNGTCAPARRVGTTDDYEWAWDIPAGSAAMLHGSTSELVATAVSRDRVRAQARIRVAHDTAPMLLSDTAVAADSDNPKMAVDGRGGVHVVWADACIQFGATACPESKVGNLPNDVFLRSWDPATGTLSPIRLVSDADGDGDSREPGVAADSRGNVHIVWVESGDVAGKGADADVVHRVLDVASGQLGPIQVLSDTLEEERTPVVAASANGTVHVAWDHAAGAVHEVAYTRLQGGQWSRPLVASGQKQQGALTVADGSSQFPALAADSSGTAHLVWQAEGSTFSPSPTESDIFYRRIGPALELGAIQRVTDNTRDGDSRLPAVAVDGNGTASVVWKDTGDIQGAGKDGDIWLRRFPASGAPGPYTLVSRSSDWESFSPCVAVTASGELVVAWSEAQAPVVGEEPRADVFVNTTIPGSGGTAFAAGGQAATSTHGASIQAAVALDGHGLMHLAWQDRGSVAKSGEDTDILFQSVPLGL